MTARIYARVSTQAQLEGYSLEAQEGRARAWCAYQGLADVTVYVDSAMSGKRNDRPELVRLLHELRRGDTVVVYALSRLGRGGAVQMLGIVSRIREAGARLVSLTEQIDTETPTGRLMLTVLAALAELEVETTRERTEMGRLQAATNGIFPHGTHALPLGWARGEDGRIVEDDHADTVRLIFRQGRRPYAQTAHLLTEMQVPTVRGGTWDVVSVRNVVIYEGYATGIMRYRSRVLPDTPEAWIDIPAPALVSPQEWKDAQRDGRLNNVHRRPERFPLTGHLRCSCGARLMGHTGTLIKRTGKVQPDSYVCYERVRKTPTCPSNGKGTKNWYTPERLHDEARRVLARAFSDPSDPARIAALYASEVPDDPHAAERSRLEAQLSTLVTLHLNGDVDHDHYLTHRATIKARLRALEPARPAEVRDMPDLSHLAAVVMSAPNEELAEWLDLWDVELEMLPEGGMRVRRLGG